MTIHVGHKRLKLQLRFAPTEVLGVKSQQPVGPEEALPARYSKMVVKMGKRGRTLFLVLLSICLGPMGDTNPLQNRHSDKNKPA